MDPFGSMLLKQHKLLKEHVNLILQIPVLPGFDSFKLLTSPSFYALPLVLMLS